MKAQKTMWGHDGRSKMRNEADDGWIERKMVREERRWMFFLFSIAVAFGCRKTAGMMENRLRRQWRSEMKSQTARAKQVSATATRQEVNDNLIAV